MEALEPCVEKWHIDVKKAAEACSYKGTRNSGLRAQKVIKNEKWRSRAIQILLDKKILSNKVSRLFFVENYASLYYSLYIRLDEQPVLYYFSSSRSDTIEYEKITYKKGWQNRFNEMRYFKDWDTQWHDWVPWNHRIYECLEVVGFRVTFYYDFKLCDCVKS